MCNRALEGLFFRWYISILRGAAPSVAFRGPLPCICKTKTWLSAHPFTKNFKIYTAASFNVSMGDSCFGMHPSSMQKETFQVSEIPLMRLLNTQSGISFKEAVGQLHCIENATRDYNSQLIYKVNIIWISTLESGSTNTPFLKSKSVRSREHPSNLLSSTLLRIFSPLGL